MGECRGAAICEQINCTFIKLSYWPHYQCEILKNYYQMLGTKNFLKNDDFAFESSQTFTSYRALNLLSGIHVLLSPTKVKVLFFSSANQIVFSISVNYRGLSTIVDVDGPQNARHSSTVSLGLKQRM